MQKQLVSKNLCLNCDLDGIPSTFQGHTMIQVESFGNLITAIVDIERTENDMDRYRVFHAGKASGWVMILDDCDLPGDPKVAWAVDEISEWLDTIVAAIVLTEKEAAGNA